MYIETKFEGVNFQQYSPGPGEDSPYFLSVFDTFTQITLRSMVNENTQAGFREAFNVPRDVEQEYSALLAIQNQNERTHGNGSPVDRNNFFARLSSEANRFTITPFSSFVIVDARGCILGRLGIGQGYAQEEVDLEALKKKASTYELTGEDIYCPGENETQLGVLLLADAYYGETYSLVKQLGFKVARFLMSQGIGKPLNRKDKEYFVRAKALVDRWTFAIVDTRKLVPGQVTEEQRKLLDLKQMQTEKLEDFGVVKRYGYLLPRSVDPRNYGVLVRIIYGQP